MSVLEKERTTARRSAREERNDRTTELFARLAETCDEAERRRLRSEIIELNIDIARSIAARYGGRGEQLEDLEQVACLGLVHAVSRFDPAHERHFLAFAVPTITGEVKKHFRDRTWVVRPPRRIQDLQSRISNALSDLRQQLHRAPTPKELAALLDEPEEDVVEALAADGCFQPTSLDQPVNAGDGLTSLGELFGSVDSDLRRLELLLTLEPALEALDEADRRLIELRFFEEMSQSRIAERLGTNQMAVSRALARILTGMRAHVA